MSALDKFYAVLPYALVAAAVLTGVIVLIVGVVRRLRSTGTDKPKLRAPTQEEIVALSHINAKEAKASYEAGLPKCVICADIATHLAPKLVRKRTGWLRALFAGAPRYRRFIPKTVAWLGLSQPYIPIEAFVFCEIHAHVADSMMDRFIFERVRAVQAEANERVAVEAAAFEQKTLIDQIKLSYSEQQAERKKMAGNLESARTPPVRLLAGNDR